MNKDRYCGVEEWDKIISHTITQHSGTQISYYVCVKRIMEKREWRKKNMVEAMSTLPHLLFALMNYA